MIASNNSITRGIALLAIIISSGLSSCTEDEPLVVASTSYDLQVVDQLGIAGTVTFTETSPMITTVVIEMTGADNTSHPAHIHLGAAVEGGDVSITLNPVINGRSSTEVIRLNNNASVSYAQLIAFDGHLNVHQSTSEMSTIIGQSDIGGNKLTANSISYTLGEFGASGVSGTAVFAKRENGIALVTISLNGTLANGIHPAAIHIGSVATVGGGPVTKTLNPVNGVTGKSYTNLRMLDDSTPISYDNVLAYDGYLAIHEANILMEVVLCQGNIGSNN